MRGVRVQGSEDAPAEPTPDATESELAAEPEPTVETEVPAETAAEVKPEASEPVVEAVPPQG